MINKNSKKQKLKTQYSKPNLKNKMSYQLDKQSKQKPCSQPKHQLVLSMKKNKNAQKQRFNLTGEIKKQDRKLMAISGDVSTLLKVLNQNNTKQRTVIYPIKQPTMTEQDIDKLFKENKSCSPHYLNALKKQHQKMKVIPISPNQDCHSQKKNKVSPLKNKITKTQVDKFLSLRKKKDLADSIDFLVQQQKDKLLDALDTSNLCIMKTNSKIDKTAKFKEQFIIGKQLGEGSYGSVRLAIWTPIKKKVAVKIYLKENIKQPQRKKSIRREIKILQKIDHPNIIRIYDVIETNNHINLIMEYVPGLSLGALLKVQPQNKFTQIQCKRIFFKLAHALKYLHSISVTHRDIKLDNILIDSNTQEPKLIDFGFSTCLDQQKKIKMFCGTPSFMSPEIVMKKQYKGQPSDIWAIGVVLYVMSTGNFPFQGNSDSELFSKICSSSYNQPYCSQSLKHLISRMLSVDVQSRITAQQILQHNWFKNITSQQINSNCDLSFEKQKRQISQQNKIQNPFNYLLKQNFDANTNHNNNCFPRKLSKTSKILNITQNKFSDSFLMKKIQFFNDIQQKNCTFRNINNQNISLKNENNNEKNQKYEKYNVRQNYQTKGRSKLNNLVYL